MTLPHVPPSQVVTADSAGPWNEWAHKLDNVEWMIEAGDTDTAYAVIADASMAHDDIADWCAARFGTRAVSNMILNRANRAMELIRIAERDLDTALGAIYYLQTRTDT